MQSQKAFTLIEIIIALTLIAVFITVPVLAYSGYSKNARDTQRKNDINKVQSALELYKANNGTYPPAENWQEVLVEGGYLSEIPSDPRNGTDVGDGSGVAYGYAYSVAEDGQSFTLSSLLEEKGDGDEGIYYVAQPEGSKTASATDLAVPTGAGTGIPSPTSRNQPTAAFATKSPTPSNTPTVPTSTPTPQWMFLMTKGSWTQSDIYKVDFSNFNSQVRLTNDPAHRLESPTYNRNATSRSGKISYLTYDPDEEYYLDLYVMNADGTGASIINTGGTSGGELSPDGTKIIYNATGGTWSANTDGTNKVNIGSTLYMEFSPDGTKVAMVETKANGYPDIFIVNVDGTNKVQLTNNNELEYNISFSPDGTKILYSAYLQQVPPNTYGIITINSSNGSGRTVLKYAENYPHDPMYVENGTKILFSDYSSYTNPGMFVMNANGTGIQKIYDTGLTRWAISPDTNYIAFYENNYVIVNGVYENLGWIRTLRLNGSELNTLIQSESGTYYNIGGREALKPY